MPEGDPRPTDDEALRERDSTTDHLRSHIPTVTGLTFVTNVTHYKSLPSTNTKQNRQVIVQTSLLHINGNLNDSSRETGLPCPGMAS